MAYSEFLLEHVERQLRDILDLAAEPEVQADPALRLMVQVEVEATIALARRFGVPVDRLVGSDDVPPA